MKVAQVTIDVYDNYGNILQKYALHRTLKKFTDSTEVLWLKDNNYFHTQGAWFSHIAKNYTPYELANPQRKQYYEAIRTYNFKEFENRYIKTRFDIPYLEELGDEYDYFVVGSDQVWKPNFLLKEFKGMFLDGVPREKKIAYAASIGLNEIPEENIDYYKQGLANFKNISMREAGGVELVKKLTGRDDIILMLDPVFLLTTKEWLQIAQKPSWFNEKYERGYIFSYPMGGTSLEPLNYFSKKLNLPIIKMRDVQNFWHYVTRPEEFIWLIAHASLVHTTSFHGTALATLFRRPLMIQEGIFPQVFDRIQTLLNLFDLNDCKFTKENYKSLKPMEIDYGTRDKVLPIERRKAFKFLSDALNALPIG